MLKTVSVRSLVIDCLALYLKGPEIFLFLPAIGCCAFFRLKTISVRYLVIDCLALYLIFLLLKTISVRYLVIDCLALYLKGPENFLFWIEDSHFLLFG